MIVDRENLSLIRQSFANAALSHKAHEAAAERKTKVAFVYKATNIGLVGTVLILLVLQTIFESTILFSYIGVGLTAAEIMTLILQESFGQGDQVVVHKAAALKYLAVRDKYKLLIADIVTSKLTRPAATQRRDQLLSEYQTISDLSLQTDDRDYTRAMMKLKLSPDGKNIWSDGQIDQLLPKKLRIK